MLMTVMAKGTSYPFVEFLLKQGADPNKQDCSGRTALMMACYWNEKKLVPLLLDYKANPNISTFMRVVLRRLFEEYFRTRVGC